jgi:hypothetical protein
LIDDSSVDTTNHWLPRTGLPAADLKSLHEREPDSREWMDEIIHYLKIVVVNSPPRPPGNSAIVPE